MKKQRPTDEAKSSAYINMLARRIGSRHEFLRDAIGVKNIALIIREAFEELGVVQRLAERIGVGGKRQDQIDPYDGMTTNVREFAESMDLWTLEQVIVRVMTEIDRRRRKYIGGYDKLQERLQKRSP